MKLQLTYRQFDRLVDVLFLLNLIYAAQTLFDIFGISRIVREGEIGLGVIAILALELVIRAGSLAIIFWSGLRDEYAERLWRRAAISFAKIILAVPWIWLAIVMIGYWTGHPIRSWLPDDPNASIISAPLAPQNLREKISVHELDGISEAIGLLWNYAPFLFISLYKWYRWRDGE